MLGKTLAAVAVMFACGALLIAVAHVKHRTPSAQRSADWVKYGVYAVVVSAMLLVAWAGRWLVGTILLLIAALGSRELKQNVKTHCPRQAWLAVPGFGALVVCYGHVLLWESSQWTARFVLAFLLVSIFDSFAQLWGRLFGRHRLCPRLSPGKTWEGLVGGFGSVCAGALALSFLVPGFSPPALIFIAMLTAGGAMAGDLAFSAVKRKLGIKDFSGLLPGHGGVLDRFDSLTIAAPVFYWSGELLLK